MQRPSRRRPPQRPQSLPPRRCGPAPRSFRRSREDDDEDEDGDGERDEEDDDEPSCRARAPAQEITNARTTGGAPSSDTSTR